MLASQFKEYLIKIQELLNQNGCWSKVIQDPHGFPLPEGGSHISQLWFMKDNTQISAKLKGVVENHERQLL